jgi:tetratricopeptide (TPR) repeat protein
MRTKTTSIAFILAVSATAQSGDPSLVAGMTALHRADHGQAERAFTEAIGAAPDNARTWYFRGVNRLAAGDAHAAVSDLDMALTLDPRDVHALLQRAEAHERIGSNLAARADLRRVLDMHTNGPAAEHALLRLGYMAMAEGDTRSALKLFERLGAIAPTLPDGPLGMGVALALMERNEEAIEAFETALERDHSIAAAWSGMARVLLRQGRRQEGCHALQQARDLGASTVDEPLFIHCDR